jgi:hypothetical protein
MKLPFVDPLLLRNSMVVVALALMNRESMPFPVDPHLGTLAATR